MNYVLLPRGIENGRGIIDKFYKQVCLLTMLQDRHKFIPHCNFTKLNLNQIKEDAHLSFLPTDYTAEDLELFYLYEKDELAAWGKKNTYGSLALPVPSISGENLYLYDQIAAKLSSNKTWIEELIRFYNFLTEELIAVDIEGLRPADFLYERDGNIKYFLGYSFLALKAEKQEVLENNLHSLAYLLYLYYLEDTEKQQAKLYQQEWFKKLEGRLIEPLVYGDSAHKLYQGFEEILSDFAGKTKYSLSQNRIGVFLDVANILTPLLISSDNMVINFDRLLARIYGKIESRKIDKKVAVMFQPTYEDNDYLDNLLFFTEEYLVSYGFQVIKVGNERQKAKTLIGGQESDVDDTKLMELIQKSRRELDSILLLTGDRHFYDLARELKSQGKEVRIISVTENSTYKGFCSTFEHSFLDEYWDCIEFLSREDVTNGSL